jgi:hypothetical protein
MKKSDIQRKKSVISCETCKYYSPTFTKTYDGYKMSCDWNKQVEKYCKDNNFREYKYKET